MYVIFEELRKCATEYEKLAITDDKTYVEYSPYHNVDKYNTKIVEFDLTQPIPPVAPPKKPTVLSNIFGGEKDRVKSIVVSARWALYDKDKLQGVIDTYKAENQKLKDLLPLVMWAQLSNVKDKVQVLGVLGTVIEDDDADTLGLKLHAQRRRLNEGPLESDKADHELKGDNFVAASCSTSSDLRIGKLQKTSSGLKRPPCPTVLMEIKPYPPFENEDAIMDVETEENVRTLASILFVSSGEMRGLRTLPFKGYIKQPKMKQYAFIYNFPPAAKQIEPESLNSIIGNPANAKERFSLSTRFHVAQMIAHSISVFHADKWVHKTLSSRSVVFFRSVYDDSLLVENPYLIDFEYSRPEDKKTVAFYSNPASAMNLYLHPDRPARKFSKVHDLYALGVVLLEIATWRSAQDIFDEACDDLGSNIDDVSNEDLRRHYIKVAHRSIPHHMGKTYLEAVVMCLNDTFQGQTGGKNFGSIFQRDVVEKLSAKHLL